MSWYDNLGNDGDIVLSTRVRLARNLSDYPFPCKLTLEEKFEVQQKIIQVLKDSKYNDLNFFELDDISQIERISLAEKHLISSEFATATKAGAMALSDDEQISIMLCEQDHIRIQSIMSGLELEKAFEIANEIDNVLEQKLSYAFNDKIGYLTQCPTDLGTGMRASLLLHLPAISLTSRADKLIATVAKLGLTLKSIYSNSFGQVGEIYQLSNQVTMGISEGAAITNLNSIATQIIAQERQAREELSNDVMFIDKIQRAFGLLSSAYVMDFAEFIQLISMVRLGSSMKILNVDLNLLNLLLVQLQPATMNVGFDEILTLQQCDLLRAKEIKKLLFNQ